MSERVDNMLEPCSGMPVVWACLCAAIWSEELWEEEPKRQLHFQAAVKNGFACDGFTDKLSELPWN